MNLDRSTEGNTRLVPDAQGQFHLLAADQSDCFLGSTSFADGSYLTREKGCKAAPYPDKKNFVERAVVEFGCSGLYDTLHDISQVTLKLPEIMQLVPDDWWRQANMQPNALVNCLTQRANRMREIVDVEKWEGLGDAANGTNLRFF